jgi:parvulin-like peptidyl-prolyl isomerase
MNYPILLVPFLLVSLASAQEPGESAQAKPAKPDVLGRIGEAEVLTDDVRALLRQLGPAERQALEQDPAVLGQVVRSLLVQQLVLKQALEKKWDKEPEVIAQLQRVRESTLTETYLQSLAAPPAAYPSEAELSAAYEANKAALLQPKSYHVAQIYIAEPRQGTTPEVGKKAQEKLGEVKAALKQPGADFAKLAATYSEEAASASKGGEIGWLAESQIQPEILKELPKLELNTVSEPVRLDDGWHVLKVLDVREPFTPTLDQVRDQLAQQLRAEKLKTNTQNVIAELVKNHPIAINELALEGLLPPKTEP